MESSRESERAASRDRLGWKRGQRRHRGAGREQRGQKEVKKQEYRVGDMF